MKEMTALPNSKHKWRMSSRNPHEYIPVLKAPSVKFAILTKATYKSMVVSTKIPIALTIEMEGGGQD